jgi:hypothetical protein
MKDALYVGGGREKTFREGNSVINIELNLTDLEAKMEGHTHEWRSKKNGGTMQKTIRLILAPLKNPDERRTHSLRIDTWKPDKSAKPNPNYYSKDGGVKRVADEFGGQVLDPSEEVPF